MKVQYLRVGGSWQSVAAAAPLVQTQRLDVVQCRVRPTDRPRLVVEGSQCLSVCLSVCSATCSLSAVTHRGVCTRPSFISEPAPGLTDTRRGWTSETRTLLSRPGHSIQPSYSTVNTAAVETIFLCSIIYTQCLCTAEDIFYAYVFNVSIPGF